MASLGKFLVSGRSSHGIDGDELGGQLFRFLLFIAIQLELFNELIHLVFDIVVTSILGLEMTVSTLPPASIRVLQPLDDLIKQELRVNRFVIPLVGVVDGGVDLSPHDEILGEIRLGLEERSNLVIAHLLCVRDVMLAGEITYLFGFEARSSCH